MNRLRFASRVLIAIVYVVWVLPAIWASDLPVGVYWYLLATLGLGLIEAVLIALVLGCEDFGYLHPHTYRCIVCRKEMKSGSRD